MFNLIATFPNSYTSCKLLLLLLPRAPRSLSLLHEISGIFDAEVYPHLPPARTMAGLLAYYLRCAKIAASSVLHHHEKGGSTIVEDSEAAGDSYLVRSVPVQTFRMKVRLAP